MKVIRNDQQGDSGLYNVAQKITDELGWIFRPQPHRDYGIDAIVEIVENKETKGQLLAFQIKSGLSWFKEQSVNDIVFRSDKEHLRYWKEYPIPVMIILHDPTTSNAYWQIVNEQTVIETEKGFKLEIPFSQTIDEKQKDDLKKYCDYSISSNSFSILSTDDLSHFNAKRYKALVLLNHKMSKGEIVQIIRSITDNLIKREFYRNKLVENCWKGKSANIVWLFVYPSLEDKKNDNWICRSEWIDPNLKKEFQPIKMNGMSIGEDLAIDWSNHYEEFSNYYKKHLISKEEFLNTVEPVLADTISIIESIIKISTQYFANSINENNFLDQMRKYESRISELYRIARNINGIPLECKDFSDIFQSLMIAASNIVIPFSEKGLEIWEKKNREALLKLYIEDYTNRLRKLSYEYEKLR